MWGGREVVVRMDGSGSGGRSVGVAAAVTTAGSCWGRPLVALQQLVLRAIEAPGWSGGLSEGEEVGEAVALGLLGWAGAPSTPLPPLPPLPPLLPLWRGWGRVL